MKFFHSLFFSLFITSLFGGGVLLQVSIAPDNPIAGQEVTFSGIANIDLTTLSCSLNFGDGEAEAITGDNQSFILTHTYADAGGFLISANCSNGTGPITSIVQINGSRNNIISVASAPVVAPDPIPTLGEWALIILGIIIIGIGIVSMRQRHVVLQSEKAEV